MIPTKYNWNRGRLGSINQIFENTIPSITIYISVHFLVIDPSLSSVCPVPRQRTWRAALVTAMRQVAYTQAANKDSLPARNIHDAAAHPPPLARLRGRITGAPASWAPHWLGRTPGACFIHHRPTTRRGSSWAETRSGGTRAAAAPPAHLQRRRHVRGIYNETRHVRRWGVRVRSATGGGVSVDTRSTVGVDKATDQGSLSAV